MSYFCPFLKSNNVKEISFIKTVMAIALLCTANLGMAQTPATHYVGVYLYPEVCYLSASKLPDFIREHRPYPYTASGIGLYYQWEKGRFWIQSGLGYTPIFFTFKIGDIRVRHPNDPVIEEILTISKVFSIGHGITLPVQCGYKFLQRPKFSMGVFGGLRWDISVGVSKKQMYYKYYNKSAVWFSDMYFHNFNAYLTAGLYFDYKPSERITLSAIPQIAYVMFSGLDPNFKEVNVGLRLQAGFRIP
jgi:hypothetical protein